MYQYHTLHTSKYIQSNQKFDRVKYPFYWFRYASPSKTTFSLSNPQLTLATFQIHYSYFVNVSFDGLDMTCIVTSITARLFRLTMSESDGINQYTIQRRNFTNTRCMHEDPRLESPSSIYKLKATTLILSTHNSQ